LGLRQLKKLLAQLYAANSDDCYKKIAIPEYFALYNNQKQFGLLPGLATTYGNLAAAHGKPEDCIGCRRCENHCPQHLPIREYLKEVAAELGG
jgi:predicted aldo/keto reductase-like oxidoreductase